MNDVSLTHDVCVFPANVTTALTQAFGDMGFKVLVLDGFQDDKNLHVRIFHNESPTLVMEVRRYRPEWPYFEAILHNLSKNTELRGRYAFVADECLVEAVHAGLTGTRVEDCPAILEKNDRGLFKILNDWRGIATP